MHRQSLIAYARPLAGQDVATPEPKGGEVLIAVSHCGVCHSDIHLQDGYFDLGEGKKLDVTGGRQLPFTFGHEIAGTVAATGPEAGDIDTTRRYAVYPWIGCGSCRRCASGNEHLCDKPHHLGINVDGGYASHVLAPDARYLIDIDGVAGEFAGSLMCSGITAYGAIKKAQAYLCGGPLAIIGLGGVGMMALQIATALGIAPIVAADISAEKRAAALERGAAHVFDPSEADARKAVFKATGPVDAACDYVGAAASINFAQSIVGKAGAVVVAGLLGGRFAIPAPMLPLRELAILGSFVGSLEDAHELVEMARSGKLSPIPVATRPLEEANSALDDLRAGKVVGRVVLTP